MVRQTTILIYLLTIQKLSKKRKNIKNNDLAKILNISSSSVNEMVNKLKNEDYLKKNLQLTTKATQFIQNYTSYFG